jgi:hypothetical protein
MNRPPAATGGREKETMKTRVAFNINQKPLCCQAKTALQYSEGKRHLKITLAILGAALFLDHPKQGHIHSSFWELKALHHNGFAGR